MGADVAVVHVDDVRGLIRGRLKGLVVDRLKNADCVALLGPRQVGKTTLAQEISENFRDVIYLDLQSPAACKQLGNGEEFFSKHPHTLVILDEIQCRPNLFPVLRSQIDQRRRELGADRGRFLILGSASLDLQRRAAESLAGRISRILISGFDIQEIIAFDLENLNADQADQLVAGDPVPMVAREQTPINDLIDFHWLRGGFPKSYLADGDANSLQWRRDFLASYIDDDIATLGIDVEGQDLRRFWELLATRQGEEWHVEKFSKDLRMPRKLVEKCKDVLEKLLFIRELRPWSGNVAKRLIKSPKLYIRDSGIQHALLKLSTLLDLEGSNMKGHSWEGYAVEMLIEATSGDVGTFFYRDSSQAEVDLVLEFSPTRRWAIEIKRGPNPNLKRGSITASETMEVERRILVHTGPEAYQAKGGFEAMPLLAALEAVASA